MRVVAHQAGSVRTESLYHVGYSTRRRLLDLASIHGEDDAIPAIERLHDFEGTVADVERAAELFRLGGLHDDARSLLDLVRVGEGEP